VQLFCSDILPEKGPNGEMQRAWDKLVEPDGHVIHLDQMLIYCTYVFTTVFPMSPIFVPELLNSVKCYLFAESMKSLKNLELLS
jgi:hypothetical protein